MFITMQELCRTVLHLSLFYKPQSSNSQSSESRLKLTLRCETQKAQQNQTMQVRKEIGKTQIHLHLKPKRHKKDPCKLGKK
uniref:Uncharacterized protein n=1 Tax=Arundo donax TaxID=35708 RepID=A0A0A9GFJ5_ARUDO